MIPFATDPVACATLSGVECHKVNPMRSMALFLSVGTDGRWKGQMQQDRPEGTACRGGLLLGNAHPSEASDPPMNFPTTESTKSIMYKSAMPIGIITKAGTHLVVHGTNNSNGT
jgi:hypothetical protein